MAMLFLLLSKLDFPWVNPCAPRMSATPRLFDLFCDARMQEAPLTYRFAPSDGEDEGEEGVPPCAL